MVRIVRRKNNAQITSDIFPNGIDRQPNDQNVDPEEDTNPIVKSCV